MISALKRGFTLVEVLVALLAMAILASLSWQGLAGLLAAREANTASLNGTQRLATVLTQWEQDLRAVLDTNVVPALQFDGRSLRLTRRGSEGGGDGDGAAVQLVVWALNSSDDGRVWQRWTSPAVATVGELQELWLRSQQLQGREPGQIKLLAAVQGWQLYYHRGDGWSNAQSSGNLVQLAPPPRAVLRSAAASAPTGGGTQGAQGTEGGTPPGAQGPAPAASAPAVNNANPATAGVREALPAAIRLVLSFDNGHSLTRDIALAPGAAP